MKPTTALYDLAALSDLSGVTPRTIRFYVEKGLLPAVGAGRVARKYGDVHLNRLRLIRQWQKQHVSINDIHERLKALSEEAVAHLLAAERPAVPSATRALDYINQVLAGRASFAEPAARYETRRPTSTSTAAARSALPGAAAASAATASPAAPADADSAAIEAMFNTFPGTDATGPAALPPTTAPSAPAPAPTDAWPRERAQWERLSLHDDVELHVHRPLSRDMNRRLERLLEVARRILHDD